MSKSIGNIVEPSDIIQSYGADTARLFILFAAPPTYALEWNDESVKGCYKFINRLIDRKGRVQRCNEIPNIESSKLSKEAKHARMKVYEALQKQQNIFHNKLEGYPFNTIIAACMEAHNAISIQDDDRVFTEGYFILLHILEGFIPHIASELSEELFHLANFKPIAIKQEVFVKDEVTYVISVNGKRRDEITLDIATEKNEIINMAKNKVQKWLTSEVKKEVFVPNKLINFVL